MPDARQDLELRLADLRKQLAAVEEALAKNAKKPDLIEYTNYEYNRLSNRRRELEASIAELARRLD